MFTKRILTILCVMLLSPAAFSQKKESLVEVDQHSLRLYNAADWRSLLTYGKERIANGIDFPLLRMRAGYAAFMLGNYSESLLQYKKVLDDDEANATALYYVYLNNLYLNNQSEARYYAGKLPAETMTAEKIRVNKISVIDGEFSYKLPQHADRGNATYGRIGLGLQLGYRFELEQSIALFSQNLSEPGLLTVTNNRNIQNNQKEYYAKATYAATGKLAVIGGYHYIYTPFNNRVYNNHLVFGGLRYTTPYAQLKLMAAGGDMTDASYSQYDFTVKLMPLGNSRLYTISRAAYGDAFTFTQVAGLQVARPLWLEGNVTFGTYRNLLEHDALYVFNDIDTKQMKFGGSLYFSFSKQGLLAFNYTFDNKLRYGTTSNYFKQHSLNTAISWRL